MRPMACRGSMAAPSSPSEGPILRRCRRRGRVAAGKPGTARKAAALATTAEKGSGAAVEKGRFADEEDYAGGRLLEGKPMDGQSRIPDTVGPTACFLTVGPSRRFPFVFKRWTAGGSSVERVRRFYVGLDA